MNRIKTKKKKKVNTSKHNTGNPQCSRDEESPYSDALAN